MTDVQNTQYQAPVQPQAPQQNFDLPQANQAKPQDAVKKLMSNPKLPVIAIAAVAAIVVIIILASILGKGYEKAVDNYFDAYFKGKVDKIEDCMPKEVWEYAAEEMEEEGVDVDGADDLVQGCKDGYLESYEENIVDGEFGEFKKFDYKIEKAKKVTDSKLEKIAEALDETYEIDEDDVKKAYKLKLDGEIVFEDDEIDLDDAGLDELYSVKIGGKWYLVAGDEDYYYLMGSRFVSYYDWEN